MTTVLANDVIVTKLLSRTFYSACLALYVVYVWLVQRSFAVNSQVIKPLNHRVTSCDCISKSSMVSFFCHSFISYFSIFFLL
ncbi:hypothetical protein BY458DRAFT_498894 [Sporodiniella umbellata]|nr:hypothetical protein BY458DRAFT_498894 [Sporodiniella umbellata]